MSLAAEIEKHFVTGFTRTRATTAQDSYGEEVRTFGSDLAVSGRLRALSLAERYEAARHGHQGDFRFYTAVGTDILVGDRIEDPAGQQYEVVGVDDVQRRGEFLQVELRWLA